MDREAQGATVHRTTKKSQTRLATKEQQSFLPLLCDILFKVLANAIRQEKELKGIDWKEEIKINEPSHSTPKYLLKKNKNICLHKNLDMNAYGSFLHNHQILETTLSQLTQHPETPNMHYFTISETGIWDQFGYPVAGGSILRWLNHMTVAKRPQLATGCRQKAMFLTISTSPWVPLFPHKMGASLPQTM